MGPGRNLALLLSISMALLGAASIVAPASAQEPESGSTPSMPADVASMDVASVDVASADVAAIGRPTAIDIRSAALLVSDQAGGSLPVAVAVFRGPGERLWVRTEIDGAAVLDALAPSAAADDGEVDDGAIDWQALGAELRIHVYAVGPSLEVVDASSLAVAVDGALATRLQDGGLRLRTALSVPWGEENRPDALPSVEIRTLVWAGEELSLGKILVPRNDGPVLFEPRFEDPGPWVRIEPGQPLAHLAVQGNDGSADGSADDSGADSEAGDGGLEGISGRPLLVSARPLTVRFAASGPAPRQVRWVVEGQGGNRLEIPLEGLRPIPGWARGVRGLAAELTLPPELGPGVYRASLEAESHAPSLDFDIAVVTAERAGVAWPRLVDLAPVTPRRGGMDGDGVVLPEEAEARVRQLRVEYLAALAGIEQSHDGDEAADPAPGSAPGSPPGSAAEALARRLALVKASAEEALGLQGMNLLHQAERELMNDLERRMRRLAAREVGRAEAREQVGGALFGWAVAHLHMAPLYTEQRHFRLARHALDNTINALSRWVPSGNAFDVTVARSLCLVALSLQKREQLSSAATHFAEALKHSDDDPKTLYAYGLGTELSGDLDAAAGALEGVVRAWPDHREARLRLASVLQRAGRASQAREHLVVLQELPSVEGDDEAWLILLAHQQRARLELDGLLASPSERGNSRRARGVVEVIGASARRFPGDPGLQLAHARALDLAGRLDEARALLNRLDRPSVPLTETVRSRYNEWPEAEFESLLAAVDADVEPHLELLAQAAASLHQAEVKK